MESNGKYRVLIVDDEKSVCNVLAVVLGEQAGYAVDHCSNGFEALEMFRTNDYDVIIQDVKMPGISGTELLKIYKKEKPDSMVVIITAYSNWETTVEAMRLGAFSYIKKPFDNEDVNQTVARAIMGAKLKDTAHKESLKTLPYEAMIGSSKAIKEVFQIISDIARMDTTVLIQGESGTGKELVARALHYNSVRVSAPFITVNCGAFPETLLESELFGYKRGAFTGATGDKKGLLELANEGTFFFDEISETGSALQTKLLRVLEEKTFRPVGGMSEQKVDVRFIASTNRNLEEEVSAGRFREDLFYRLNVIPVFVPPLRERREDIPILAGHFLSKFNKMFAKEVKGFTTDALYALTTYNWPGNIRELENVIQKVVVLKGHRGLIDIMDITEKQEEEQLQIPEEGFDMEKEIEKIEKKYIMIALEKTGGHLTNTAKLLNVSFRALRYKIKKYSIAVDDSK